MTQHIPYRFTTSGGSPDKIWLDGKVIAQLSNTTYAVANHIVTCLNTQPELLEWAGEVEKAYGFANVLMRRSKGIARCVDSEPPSPTQHHNHRRRYDKTLTRTLESNPARQ